MITSYAGDKKPIPPEQLHEIYSSDWLIGEMAEIERADNEDQPEKVQELQIRFLNDIFDLLSAGHPRPQKLADYGGRVFKVLVGECCNAEK